MSFWRFLVFGWLRIQCSHCSARLTLKSVGERFWKTLAVGATIVAVTFLFVDYLFRWLGDKGTLALFVITVVVTPFLAVYFAWKDSRFELYQHANH